MNRSLRIYIPESENILVLIDLVAGNFPGNNFAKQTIIISHV
jgi:hypothetical protein